MPVPSIPKFIILTTRAYVKDKPVVLVGKGITFDTGGISLKPGEGMHERKYDTCAAPPACWAPSAAIAQMMPINRGRSSS